MSNNKLDFSDEETKNWFKNLAQSGKVVVSFMKKDGTARKMTCTLSEEFIPSEKMPKNTGKSQNSDVLAVFDLEKDEWRSFRWDSVTEINFKLL
jgi:uncharacterized pyridoxamine 5'-phosphate oxidase family protein